jgi:nucleolar protein 4
MPKFPSHKGRLVVRILPYTYTLDQLKALFSPIGPIKDAALPFDDGKKAIKGLVSWSLSMKASAAKAVKKLNGTKIQKRGIAVDWALSKTRYEEALKKEQDVEDFKPSVEAEAKADEDSEEAEEEEEKRPEKKPRTSTFYRECTLYVRNISYETEDEDFHEYFEQYGKVRYANVVVDPNTGARKGSGFVCYYKPEDAQKAMTALANTEEVLELDGRRPNAIIAVPRKEAATLARSTDKKADKRNLYLSKEGLIKPGTEAFETLSKEEISRRTNAARAKKERLQNPNVFVSTTRKAYSGLLFRNIPRDIDEKQLKQVCREAVEATDEKLKRVKLIRQVKLMKDDTRMEEGKPRSRVSCM